MHTHDLRGWQHDHVFEQDHVKPGEKRTLLVVILTAIMMVVEIVAGFVYGSMALLADGLHMASHATALGIALLAYILSRRLATDRQFTFGTGKINSLAGFASALLLLAFAFAMVTESADRLVNPIAIAFDQALIVAVVGLVVNGVSAWVLATTPHHHYGNEQTHTQHHDHNLRGAYLHVLADTVTSALAIVALLSGKYLGADWLDPMMGIVGAILVARWSYGLIRDSSQVLLDKQADEMRETSLRHAIENSSSDRISDLHLWSIGHRMYAAELAIITDELRSLRYYKSLIPAELNIVHVTIEVHQCPSH